MVQRLIKTTLKHIMSQMEINTNSQIFIVQNKMGLVKDLIKLQDGTGILAICHNMFSYTWIRLCHTGQKHTLFEIYRGKRSSVRHLQSFGTIVYVDVPKMIYNIKLDPKAIKAKLIGYTIRTKG